MGIGLFAMGSEADSRRRDWGHTLLEFIRFGIVGGSGVVVNLVVAYIMTQLNGGVSNDNRILFDLPGPYAFRWTLLVWIVGFLVANVWNFQLNRVWTFQRDRMRGWWEEFWPFFAIGLVAAAVGAALKVGFTNPTSPIYLPSPPFNTTRVCGCAIGAAAHHPADHADQLLGEQGVDLPGDPDKQPRTTRRPSRLAAGVG